MRRASGILVLTLAAGLAGCQSLGLGGGEAPATPAPGSAAGPPPYPVDRLVGEWGVAAYRQEKDRVRTEAMARAACKAPLDIKRGPSDGVITYVADDKEPHELTLKKGADGKVYFGFAGPAGDPQDREILKMTDNEFVARYVDPDTNMRFGTLVYIRCKA